MNDIAAAIIFNVAAEYRNQTHVIKNSLYYDAQGFSELVVIRVTVL